MINRQSFQPKIKEKKKKKRSELRQTKLNLSEFSVMHQQPSRTHSLNIKYLKRLKYYHRHTFFFFVSPSHIISNGNNYTSTMLGRVGRFVSLSPEVHPFLYHVVKYSTLHSSLVLSVTHIGQEGHEPKTLVPSLIPCCVALHLIVEQ